MTQTHINIVVAFLTGVVGPVAVIFIRDWLERKKKKHDPIHEELDTANSIIDRLEKILRVLRCDRVWILQFHNGGHFYPTGKSIQKYSMFYEIVSPETYSAQAFHQNIPVNLFSKVFKDVISKGYVAISDFENPQVQNYGMQYIAQEMQTKSQYIFAIRNINGKLIGCLGTDFTKSKIRLDNLQLNNLQVDAATIGGILDSHLKK